MKAWTQAYMIWVKRIRFSQVAQESTRLDYLTEVEHMGERVARLEKAFEQAVKLASPEIQEVVGIYRHRADLGGNDCGGAGQYLPL